MSSVAVEAVFQQASNLSEEDRAALAGLLLESLHPKEDADAADLWRDEVSRRLAEIKSGQVEGIPWATVLDRMRSRRGRP